MTQSGPDSPSLLESLGLFKAKIQRPFMTDSVTGPATTSPLSSFSDSARDSRDLWNALSSLEGFPSHLLGLLPAESLSLNHSLPGSPTVLRLPLIALGK